MRKGISDFHCLSDAYLVDEILLEQKYEFCFLILQKLTIIKPVKQDVPIETEKNEILWEQNF